VPYAVYLYSVWFQICILQNSFDLRCESGNYTKEVMGANYEVNSPKISYNFPKGSID